jgi:hypothetical protein
MLPSNEKFKNKMHGYNMYLINFGFFNCPKITINISNNYTKWLKFEPGDHLALCNAINKTQIGLEPRSHPILCNMVLCNAINKSQLFGLKSCDHPVLCNAINKGQLFGLKSGGHPVLCNAINKEQMTMWP